MNCTAELKALSDIVCTSSNAVAIVESLPADQKIIFGPDKNLGAYVAKKTGRDLVLWNGACMVHEIFSREKMTRLKERHPNAKNYWPTLNVRMLFWSWLIMLDQQQVF